MIVTFLMFGNVNNCVAKLQESHAAQFTAEFSVIQFQAVAKLIRGVIL